LRTAPRAGDLTIDHPYAVPTLAGVSTGALYFRAITNNGNEPDHLLSARTKVADSVDCTICRWMAM
jgi:copper(I)-binding protein